MSKLTEEEKILFAQAMQGVEPQKPNNKAPSNKPKKTIKHKRYRSTASYETQLDDSTTHLSPYSSNEQVTAHQSLSYFKSDSRTQDRHKLKTGNIAISARLDLHGYTEDAALDKLKEFIQRNYLNNNRYLLLIHGKGYNSDTSYPVIKNLVNQFLPQFKQVLGYCSAQQKDGGTGAIYIWLKKS